MKREEVELLCRADIREAVERNLGRDPVAVALDKHTANAALVATQVKYLQRARRKLPSFFGARCIIPSLAFEQSSGEECALRKGIGGRSAVDLTCGLGSDSYALSKCFPRVVAVERDDVLAAVASENFRRLGADNIDVVCCSAEDFVRTTDERFDWCFADPDRRGADGSKRVLAEDCSPDMVELVPVILNRGVARRILIKMSPMFDVEEAFRVFGRFGRCSVEVVSQGDECKEVLVRIDDAAPERISAVAVGKGEFSVLKSDMAVAAAAEGGFADARFLIIPDVALQKSRLVRRYFAGMACAYSENGFAFANERPPEGVLGRVFEIDRIERYEPRRLRRELKGVRAEMILRDVPLTTARIMQATGLREGGDLRMAFTTIGGEIWAIRLK